ncbi:hypothetical protein [Brenneria izadpanahii]|nr:hypothetical protein [Brenneria izadpanahii]
MCHDYYSPIVHRQQRLAFHIFRVILLLAVNLWLAINDNEN